ncbi:MAG: aminoacyl-histidine dipeptidase [Bacteroidales bacterium]|nr:aminoacyl-histidine dipeptidase [Bacteroidales bacterium]
MANNSILADLEPKSLFRFFGEILSIPRPSKHEEKMTEYLVNWAKERNLDYESDEIGNVIIRKGATKGKENSPWVCLQSHIDMVCEKNSDKDFDFEKDAIVPKIEGEWLKADGTTLGADDGIGVATALAILDANDIEHGPIECLFTVDEETGLSGAEALSPDVLKSRILLNLDSEDEGEIFIGCAGGIDTVARLPFDKEETSDAPAFKIMVKGLKGGHSGDDINKGLACANKLLNRILWSLDKEMDLRLACFDGGNLRNAIAREAYATFVVAEADVELMKEIVEKFTKDLKYEFRTTEPDMEITLMEVEKPEFVVDMLSQDNLLNVLYACPHGVLAMSREIPGFVETSTNLASIKMKEDHFFITTSQRSSVESSKYAAAYRVESCFLLAGADVEHGDGYPGWAPNPESKILKIAVDAYKKLFNKEPIVRAIHAGLECGLIGEKYPGMDMISYGPTLRGVHSPDERLEIKTVELYWKHTLEILKNI